MYKPLKSWQVTVLKELKVLDFLGNPTSKYAAGFSDKLVKTSAYQKIFYYALKELGETTDLNTVIPIKYLGLVEANLYFAGYIPVKPPFIKKGVSIVIALGDAIEILENVEFPGVSTTTNPEESQFAKQSGANTAYYVKEEVKEKGALTLKKWQVDSFKKLNVLDAHKMPTEEYKNYFVGNALVNTKAYSEIYKQALGNLPKDTKFKLIEVGLSKTHLVLSGHTSLPDIVTAQEALEFYNVVEVPWVQTIREAGISVKTLIEKGILVDENTVAEEWKSEVYISKYYGNNVYNVTDKVIVR